MDYTLKKESEGVFVLSGERKTREPVLRCADCFRGCTPCFEGHLIDDISLIYTSENGTRFYLGGHEASRCRCIQTPRVLSVREIPALQWDQEEKDMVHLKVLDDPSEFLKPHIKIACEFLRESIVQKKDTLVHCAAGMSRSPAILMAFLMLEFPEQFPTFEVTLKYVQGKRRVVGPNYGFRAQLSKLHEMMTTDAT